MQKIYIEMVFLDNFIVNLLIIFLASLLTGSKKRWGRFAASASIGGAYACAVFGASGLGISFPAKAVVSALMCFAAFYAKSEKNFWKNICAFYITSFVFAGAVYGITFCFGQPQTFGGAIAVRPIASYIVIGLATGAVAAGFFSRVRKRTIERESKTVIINAAYGGRTAELKAFVDTGNMITEPLGGLGVVFVSAAAAKELLGKDTLSLLNCRGSPLTEKLRIIPIMTAAGPSLFYGIEIDGITLKGQRKRVRAVVCAARGTLAYGCGAVIGSGIFDELMKGADNDKVFCEENSGVDIAADGNSAERGLHKWQRGAASAAHAAGGEPAAPEAGEGGQVGQAHIDRA